MSDLMAERYGARQPGKRRLLILLAAIVAVAGLAWIAWAAWFHGTPDVQAEVAAYDISSDRSVEVTLAVRLSDEDTPATCLVRAVAADHSIVGEKNVRVDELAATGDNVVTVRTERRATSVSVLRCRAD